MQRTTATTKGTYIRSPSQVMDGIVTCGGAALGIGVDVDAMGAVADGGQVWVVVQGGTGDSDAGAAEGAVRGGESGPRGAAGACLD